MFRGARFAISTCKERSKLYKFVRECFVRNLPQVQESVTALRDPAHTVRVLNALQKVKQADIVETCKSTIRTMSFDRMRPQLATDMASACLPFMEEHDLIIYDKIYTYARANKELFKTEQLKRLERIFYEVTQLIPLKTPIELHRNSTDLVPSKNGLVDPRAVQKQGVVPIKAWQLIVRQQPDEQTNSAQLKYGKHRIQIQGLHSHYLDDLVLAKSTIERDDKTFCINLPPLLADPESKSFQFLNAVDHLIKEKETYNVQNLRFSLEQQDLHNAVQHLKKSFIQSESNVMFTGNYLGNEVPYNLQSLIYYLQKNTMTKNLYLTDLSPNEKIDILLAQADKPNLSLFRYIPQCKDRTVWLTMLFEWSLEVTKLGCFNCAKQPVILPDPADIIDNFEPVRAARVQFITSMLRHSLVQHGSQRIFIQQHLFWDVLRELVSKPLPTENATNFQDLRNALLAPNHSDEELREQFQQFYHDFETHQNDIEKRNKVKNFPILDLNSFSQQPWRNSHQLRCAARDILF